MTITIDLTDTEVLDMQHVFGADLATAIPAYLKNQCATNWGKQREAAEDAKILKGAKADEAIKAAAMDKAGVVEAQEAVAKAEALAAEAAKGTLVEDVKG